MPRACQVGRPHFPVSREQRAGLEQGTLAAVRAQAAPCQPIAADRARPSSGSSCSASRSGSDPSHLLRIQRVAVRVRFASFHSSAAFFCNDPFRAPEGLFAVVGQALRILSGLLHHGKRIRRRELEESLLAGTVRRAVLTQGFGRKGHGHRQNGGVPGKRQGRHQIATFRNLIKNPVRSA